MTQFEFLMMVAAVVIAVGLAEILGSWGKLLRSDQSLVRYDWLHAGHSTNLVLTTVQYWVGMWAYSPLELSSVLQVYFLIIPSFFLVVASFAISPDAPTDKVLNCREYYLSRRAAIFVPIAIGGLLSVIADGVIAGFDNVTLEVWLIFGVGAGINLTLAVTTRIWFHTLCWPLGLVQIAFFMAADLGELNARFLS